MKKILAFILATFMIFAFSACEEEKVSLDILTLKGPTGIGMVKLMKDNPDYNFTISSAPDEIVAAVIKGEYDIAAVPINLASTLYAKTNGELQIAAINTLGVLYILENGNTINSLEDLEGKKIYATGQGSTPEYILNALLEKKGVNCEVEYLTEHTALVTQMVSGDILIGMLPEPNVTTALSSNQDLRIALDLTEEWNKLFDYELIQGCIIVNKKFAEENENTLKTFLKDYKASVDYVNANLDDAATLCETYEIIPKAALAKKAIPNCNITYIDGDEMKSMTQGIFNMLYEQNPQSIGGAIPDEAIYR
ncbi:MAG: hypothetical protein A2Y17_12855 [Clostridiales bacterium GWF2_38_85]|nr:MAG: hypothetical protein A2Y17_12855 [Clostridiales bacterium GWF2_38_85]HBL84149.1 sulfonate/nitrate/taurine transporter substrate-binding protein [Clostridiales bacterium]